MKNWRKAALEPSSPASQAKLILIEKTGRTYQMKHQEVADEILHQLQEWRNA